MLYNRLLKNPQELILRIKGKSKKEPAIPCHGPLVQNILGGVELSGKSVQNAWLVSTAKVLNASPLGFSCRRSDSVRGRGKVK